MPTPPTNHTTTYLFPVIIDTLQHLNPILALVILIVATAQYKNKLNYYMSQELKGLCMWQLLPRIKLVLDKFGYSNKKQSSKVHSQESMGILMNVRTQFKSDYLRNKLVSILIWGESKLRAQLNLPKINLWKEATSNFTRRYHIMRW